jgi:osmotically-inducible protein OsmY
METANAVHSRRLLTHSELGTMDASQEPRSAAAGTECARLLEQALRRAPHVPVHSIVWEIEDATIVLRGRVRSFYLKQLAQSVVLGVPGIARVINEIEVEGRRARNDGDAADAG